MSDRTWEKGYLCPTCENMTVMYSPRAYNYRCENCNYQSDTIEDFWAFLPRRRVTA